MSEQLAEFKKGDMRPVLLMQHRAAQRQAHRTFSFSSAVWPEEWFLDARDEFVDDFFDFCNRAYRVSEMLGILSERIDISEGGTVSFQKNEGINWLFDYHHAINRVRHCVSFKFGNSNPPESRQLFRENKNIMGAFVRVVSDKYPLDEVDIPVFALAFTYLQRVRPKVALALKQRT